MEFFKSPNILLANIDIIIKNLFDYIEYVKEEKQFESNMKVNQ